MISWLRRLLQMPDRERARLLAVTLGTIIIIVLYLLGVASLYVRLTYLRPATVTPLPPVATVTPTPAVTPGPSLFPTLTPRP